MSAPPSDAAVRAANDLCFEAIVEFADRAASYARSASEAAFRGDQHTVRIHLGQLRLTVIAALQTAKEIALLDSGEIAEAA
jgi:hypothetical protein